MSLKILVVGAGGLGCELLKLLSKNKEYEITIIDVDTVDATNLNRQFLFTKADVGKSKALCAASKIFGEGKAATENATIVSIHGKIQDYPSIEFYKKYSIVFTCLDNNETRSFVNQRCKLAEILMIDGGSAGWLGQSFHNGGECFDCLPKRSEEIIPICMTRQYVTEFKHCIGWAMSVVDSKNTLLIYEDLLGVTSLENDELTTPGSVNVGNGAIKPLKSCVEGKEPSEHSSSSEKENVAGESPSPSVKRMRIDSALVADQVQDSVLTVDSSSDDVSFCEDVKLTNHTTNLKFYQPAKPTLISSDEPVEKLVNLYVEKLKGDFSTEDRTELIYNLAVLKARKHNVDALSYFDGLRIIDKIIPSVCTTNSIVASLMIISIRNRRNYYLVQSSSRFVPMDINPGRKDCATCSMPLFICRFGLYANVCSLLTEFKAMSAATESKLYGRYSSTGLSTLNGQFIVLQRGELSFRVYLEKILDPTDKLSMHIIRIK